MNNQNRPISFTAGAFDVGNICPCCQEAVAKDELIVKCEQCGTLHHEICWRENGCKSYHCDTKASKNLEKQNAGIVISFEETENVYVPPKPAISFYRSPEMEEIERPKIWSILSIFSFILAIGSIFVGYVKIGQGVEYLGLVLSILIGIIAMLRITIYKYLRGITLASLAVFLSTGFLFFKISQLKLFPSINSGVEMRISQNRPTEEDLQKMKPNKANALRANVVLKSLQKGLFRSIIYGSGIITKIEKNTAFILTNKHVIGKGTIEVYFSGEEREKKIAKVEWLAPGEVDIAIISCLSSTQNRKFITLETKITEQGAKVFAVGNPLSLPWSYTEGVISAIRRQEQGEQKITIYQTQTPINSGNSGGGLYNMMGRLIGVNTWTKDKSVAEGLNFAISTKSILQLLGKENRRRFID